MSEQEQTLVAEEAQNGAQQSASASALSYKWQVRYLHQEETYTPKYSAATVDATFVVLASDVQEAIRKTEPLMERVFTAFGREAVVLVEVRSVLD